MAEPTRSSVLAIKKETETGKLVEPAAEDFIPLREGFSFTFATEALESDELVNSIGRSKPQIGRETPTASLPVYLKGSGTEGEPPEYGLLIESGMGSENIISTERSITAGTTKSVTLATGEGINYQKGTALLIKDSVNGWSIRNVLTKSSDLLNLNFDLENAPAASVKLGKPIHYAPKTSGHPKFSAHLYQSSEDSLYHQAMAGGQVTSMPFDFPANDFASATFEFGGLGAFYNPVTIVSGRTAVEFNDGAAITVNLDPGIYKTPQALARHVQLKMRASESSGTNCVVEFVELEGKFRISGSSDTFTLDTDQASVDGGALGILGFTEDQTTTGNTSYTAANKFSFAPSVTPAYDSANKFVVKGAELFIGKANEILCRPATVANFTVSVPKTDVPSICEPSGFADSVINEREVVFTTTIVLAKYESSFFDRFVNNEDFQVMFNIGLKEGGNWKPGNCMNIFLPQANVTALPIEDSDGYQVMNLEATASASTGQEDCHINFL